MWPGPSRVDGVRVVGDCVVWASSEGLVTTPMTSAHTSTVLTTATTTAGQFSPSTHEKSKDRDGDSTEWDHISTTKYIRCFPFTKLDAVEVR